ncbi:serine/threonine-protein kinase [Nocardia sp. NPDC020380]|uniref:serine/threonine-protein kinase n=1 Tax=Nocardia sp. NPDC020380 TaxID=3364309 RepID=UPI0037A33AE8
MSEPLTPGTLFAGYTIERALAHGGMGTVYLARHPRLPRNDALKVLPQALTADPEFQRRFQREAEITARLEHPNIVTVHDRGIDRGCLWMAMQFVDGSDVAELIRRSPAGVAPGPALHIVTEAARGLDEAHRHGLLHRDVKPANLLLRYTSEAAPQVLVADFGIAKAAGSSTALTRTGSVLATVAYAAPEQLTGGTVDHRADIYALGCTFFELLTGSKPFPRADLTAIMHAHLTEPPPRASALNPALPQAIDTVLARAMAKDPLDRYETCAAFATAAAAGLDGTPDIYRPPARRMQPGLRRRMLPLAIATVVAGLVVTGVLALNRYSTGHPAALPTTSGNTTAAPATTTTATGAAASWGNYGFVIDAFPRLLPATPITSGYDGLRCRAADKDMKPVDVNARPAEAVYLDCDGNGSPLGTLMVFCNSSRTPTAILGWPDSVTHAGDQQWQRPSGNGRMVWGDAVGEDNKPQGSLQVGFDDAGRNFCLLMIWGGSNTTGADLVDHWWHDAPL